MSTALRQLTMTDEEIAEYCEQLRREADNEGRKGFAQGFALGVLFAFIMMVTL